MLKRLPIGGFADGSLFPFVVMPIDFRHNLCGYVSSAAKRVLGDFLVVRQIDQPAEGIVNFIECLTGETVDREDETRNICRYAGEFDVDRFVVAVSCSRSVIAGVLNASVLTC